MKKLSLLTVVFLFISNLVFCQVVDEFRGLGRTGVYDETGLLKEWPEGGPEVLWSIENLPEGHSSITVGYDMLFLTGIQDTMDVVIALDMQGNIKWTTEYGRSWMASFPKSRCTPTIEGEKIYVTSGWGEVVCLDAYNGEIKWSVDASGKYEGPFGRWGIAESLLVMDDKVFFTCGGPNTTMIALDKLTGETIWTSESIHDQPSYTSARIVENEKNKIIVNMTKNFVFGVNPETGNVLWKFSYGAFTAGRHLATIQCNIPVYDDGKLFMSNGYDQRNVMLRLSEDLTQVYFEWTTDVLDTHHGGQVKIGNYVYGPSWDNNRMGKWVCLNWETGETQYETEWINKGSIVAADGMLFCFEEKTGNLAMVEATPEEFRIKGTLHLETGNRGPYWSHPKIKDGILYLRHLNALKAYKIK